MKLARSGADEPSAGAFPLGIRKALAQDIISDGHTLWVYLPDNQQVIASNSTDASRSKCPTTPDSF